MTSQNSILDAAVGAAQTPATSNPHDKYAALLTHLEDEREGTFIMPSVDGDIIRLYDSSSWSKPDKPEGYLRLVTRYLTATGELGNRLSIKQNSILFKGDLKALTMMLNRWKKLGQVAAIVAHLEYTQDEVDDDPRLQTLLERKQMSVKKLPVEGGEDEVLLYGGKPAFMFQQLVQKPFDAMLVEQLTKRLGSDDKAAERYANSQAEAQSADKAAMDAFDAVEAQKLQEAKDKGIAAEA